MRLSDTYYITIPVLGAAVSFALGLSRLKRDRVFEWSIVLGIALDVPLVLLQGGPGLILGMLVMPLVNVGVAKVGRGVRTVLIRAGLIDEPHASTPDAPRCAGCGYLLVGLPGHVCPECGRAFGPQAAAAQVPAADEGAQ